MNRIKTWLHVLLITLLVLLLPACSCAKPETESGSVRTAENAEESKTEMKEKKEDISGQYEITAMITEGEETPSEDLELLKSRGLNCTIPLKSDGTGVLNLFGEETEMTWNEKTITAAGKERPYTWKNRQLILTDGNSSLTFRRKE